MVMNSRERVRRTLLFKNPDRPPRHLWWAGMWTESKGVLKYFPGDFTEPVFKYGESKRARWCNGKEVGTDVWVDEWGCPWSRKEPEVVGEVKNPPLADWSALVNFSPPWEILDGADLSQVNKSCAQTDKFVLAVTTNGPFERMQFLRGSENLFMDLGYGVKEVFRLRDMIHEFLMRLLKMWIKTDVDGIWLMDDLGSETSLLISPDMWRDIFKPLYAEYCALIKNSGKFVFVHSGGNISSILPEFIDIGVDAVNTQLFHMGIEDAAAKYKGKVTFWGDIDVQRTVELGTAEDVKRYVRRLRSALDDGTGGVIAQYEWNPNPHSLKDNVLAFFEAWNEPINMNNRDV